MFGKLKKKKKWYALEEKYNMYDFQETGYYAIFSDTLLDQW